MITGVKCPACGEDGKSHCDNPVCTWVRCGDCKAVVGRYKAGVRSYPTRSEGEPR